MHRTNRRHTWQGLTNLEPRTLFDSSLAAVPQNILNTVADIQSVISADLNGDGRPDLAISAGRDLLVLFRNAKGGYADPVIKHLGSNVGKLAVVHDGSALSDLVSFGGRAAADRTFFRLFDNLGAGNFRLLDQDSVASDPSFNATLSTADLTGDGVDEVFLNTHTGGEPLDRLYWFSTVNHRLDPKRLLATIPVAQGSLAAPVFSIGLNPTDRGLIYASNRNDVAQIISIPFTSNGPGAAQVVATRPGQIQSLLLIPSTVDGPGQLIVSRTDALPPGTLRLQPGDAVVESLAADGSSAARELYREAPEAGRDFFNSGFNQRTISLLAAADMNGDGRLDIVAEDRSVAHQVFLVGTLNFARTETSLLQLVAQPVAPGSDAAYNAVHTHDVGGLATSAPLPAYHGPRYVIGDFAGTSIPDMLVFTDNSLRLARSDATNKAPAVSRLETASIFIKVLGAFGFTAQGVFDPDQVRGGNVDLVRCFRDSNHNGVLDTGDALFSVDSDGGDGWSFGGILQHSWGRKVRFFVQAQDNTGQVSAPAQIDYQN